MMQPIIHEQLTHIFVRHFGATPGQAAKLATKLITTLEPYGLQVIRGDWQTPVKEELTWETLASRADALVEARSGIRPWNPPELQ